MSYRKNSKDYIPTAADIMHDIDEREARVQAARDNGYHLGEFEVTYNVQNQKFTQRVFDYSEKDAVDNLKKQCGMIGWIPRDISIKTIVKPNIYV